MAKKRHALSRSKSAKVFRRGARSVHKLNSPRKPMRGGIRL